METIDINEVFAQANVVENLKNFAGVDAQNALGMMTPERLAAVVGGKLRVLNGTVVLQPDEYITLDVGYGILIVTNTTNGWCNVSILCSLDVVQALSQHNGGILIEKASEHKTKIINKHNKDLALGYLFLGDLYI